MANVDLTQALGPVDMTELNFATFNTLISGTPTRWNWRSTAGHDFELQGSGLTYDATGRATGGSVNAIGIDLDDDATSFTDVVITGFSLAAGFFNSPATFWQVLSGDDTIFGPLKPNVPDGRISYIFGDGQYAFSGNVTGGNDFISAGDTTIFVYGDVLEVGSSSPGAPTIVYQGGNDGIFGANTNQIQYFFGDVSFVAASATFTGGEDTIFLNSSAASRAVGDASFVSGFAGNLAEATGGGDDISAGGATGPMEIIGDFEFVLEYSVATGGNDEITGGSNGDTLVGDATLCRGSQLDGGDDAILGGGGADTIAGDTFNLAGPAAVLGGNDELHGGTGNDAIFGEIASFVTAGVSGGDDLLYGEGDNDSLHGQTGNDLLDGGTGNDTMVGGVGNDAYYVDAAADTITELSGEGYDTVNTTTLTFTLGANVERVNFIGSGNFVGTGNNLANRFQSGSGDDRFVDVQGGNDIFSGGAGTDTLDFRTSATGAVINMATLTHGGAAAGDSYSGIEKFLGSNTAADAMTGGGAGRWVFVGGGGGDTLTGGVKNDQLIGQAGNDTLVGGADRDSLDGGTGNDAMTGGAAGDVFVFIDAAFGQDTIMDYQDGLDSFKVFSAVADNINDFTITNNGTTSVRLTLASAPTHFITINGAAPITIAADDFVFF